MSATLDVRLFAGECEHRSDSDYDRRRDRQLRSSFLGNQGPGVQCETVFEQAFPTLGGWLSFEACSWKWLPDEP
jgi:hypothetical protein